MTCFKMIFCPEFHRLVLVCLKMLFRESTRKRFALLVLAFMFMMGFNTGNYVKKYHLTEARKKAVLEEKAFTLFFLRMNSRNSAARFILQKARTLERLGAVLMDRAFIYQNNLFVHVSDDTDRTHGGRAMHELAAVLGIEAFAKDFFVSMDADRYDIRIRNVYVDHNGAFLEKESRLSRKEALQADLIDMADAIRGNLKGRRLEAYNLIKNRIVDHIARRQPAAKKQPNPFLSRLQSIVPVNLLYILSHVRNDNTTDIMDLPESVRAEPGSELSVFKPYLNIPEPGDIPGIYADIEEIYPRYLPLYVPGLLSLKWNWLLVQQIQLNGEFMKFMDRMHFMGHYLFSYEKSHIIKDLVRRINDDIRIDQIFFYLTDLSMGIVFPFMMSLFTFIHLKAEIAFLLMFKNRIRQILFIFWLLPMGLMLLVKGSIAALYVLFQLYSGQGIPFPILLPLMITFLLAALIFYPVNRWCFSQLTGSRLNLYELHRGR